MALYIKETGNQSSPMLVFLHGGGVSGWMWEKQVEYFKDDYYILVPDLPSHGNSREEQFFSIHQTAKDIIHIIEEKKNGQKITIIGFSLGAQIAIEILSLNKDMIDRAIIISVLVMPMKYVHSMIKPLTRITMPLTKNKLFAKLQAKVLYIREEQFDLYYQDTNEMTVEALHQILEENMTYRIPDGFKYSTAKIMVLVGDKEKTAMRKSAIAIKQSNQNCQGYVVHEVGHGISLADAHFFNSLVEAWIDEQELPVGMNPIL